MADGRWDCLAGHQPLTINHQPSTMSLSHIDEQGRAQMVDVTAKPETRRIAIAAGMVRMRPETVGLIERQEVAKGDVLTVAKVAAILAAKQTAALIPMCHPLLLTDV